MLKHCLRYFPVVVVLLLGWLLWRGLLLDSRILPSTHINRPAPHFVLPSLLHSAQSFNDAIFQKRWTVVTFWASWCGACTEEQPALLAIARNHPVQWIGINYKDTQSDAIKWLKRYGNPFDTVGIDAKGTIGIEWGVYGTPEHYLVDPQGIIRDRYLGPMTEKFWETRWHPLVQQR